MPLSLYIYKLNLLRFENSNSISFFFFQQKTKNTLMTKTRLYVYDSKNCARIFRPSVFLRRNDEKNEKKNENERKEKKETKKKFALT